MLQQQHLQARMGMDRAVCKVLVEGREGMCSNTAPVGGTSYINLMYVLCSCCYWTKNTK